MVWPDFLGGLGVSRQSLQAGDLADTWLCRVELLWCVAWAGCLLSPSDIPALFSQDTFARAKNWVKELQRQASPNIVIALAGNKADLANKRAVEFQVWGMDRPGGRREPAAWLCPGCSRLQEG